MNKAPSQRLCDVVDFSSKSLGSDTPQIVEIETLRSMPEGSFGHAWAEFLAANQLEVITCGSRRKQLHDGVHVLTGYGYDLLGEAQVQAFMLGAKWDPAHAAILFAIFRDARRYGLPIAWDALHKAYQRGQRSLFNPDRWPAEKLLDLPLSCVRTCMNL